MMRGIIVVITAIFSVVFLKRKLYFHHWFAVVFIVVGVAEVGLVAILGGSSTVESGSVALGILLLLVS
jgi:drug/metabolite transporter (DMT)-like permease